MLSPILLTVVADKFSLELLLKPLHKRFRLQRDPFLDGEISYQTRNIGLWRFPFWISRVILLTPKIYWFFFSFETGTGSITLNVMYDCMLHFTLNLKRLPFPPPPPPKKKVSQLNDVAISGQTLNLLYKMRYILWVVALLEACDVTKHNRHLGFYQDLEIS